MDNSAPDFTETPAPNYALPQEHQEDTGFGEALVDEFTYTDADFELFKTEYSPVSDS